MAPTRRKKAKAFESPIKGHLDIFAYEKKDLFADASEGDSEEVIDKRLIIMIHGDPEGLRSLADFLVKMADKNQEDIRDMPIGGSDHEHLRPNLELSKSSMEVIVGKIGCKRNRGILRKVCSKSAAIRGLNEI
jgi:hypothetical protein